MDALSKKVWEGTAQFFIGIAVLLFLPAWSLIYWQGWLFLGVLFLSVIYINLYFLKHDPKLIESRLQVGPTAEKEKSQKIIQTFTMVFVVLLAVVPALDYRFHWTHVSAPVVLIADLFVLLSFAEIFLVFKQNSYTSAIIETKKEQKVISTGLYSIVRHPMYSGGLLIFFAVPLALGSYIGFLVSILLTIFLIIRLLDEERILKRNLKGYKEYCQKVKYHLVPYVW